jgi:MoaA/NifB/PqqE/SkfB family radical SAM enzyme
MTICPNVREEQWGRIIYDPESDEFQGYVVGDDVNTSTTRPISAGCLVTRKCDLKCDYCYGNDESLPKKEITPEEWGEIFSHLKKLGLMRVDLSGGEPTLRNDLPRIAEAALDVGLYVVISTNGRRLSGNGPTGFPDVRWHVSMDSGFSEIHESSRLLRSLAPSRGSFEETSAFISKCIQQKLTVRALTCIGHHNCDGLFALGEHLAMLGVQEWNISKILRAGRAQKAYAERFPVNDNYLLEQIHDLRAAFPFLRIRYSNRTDQDGYFLLVLPDGSMATQYTDGRDKVVLGKALEMNLASLQNHPEFHIEGHCRKWIASFLDWRPGLADMGPDILSPTGPVQTDMEMHRSHAL